MDSRRRGIVSIILMVILLYLSFTLFSSSFLGASEIVKQTAETLGRLVPSRGEVETVRVEVRILYADLGYGYLFHGNETPVFSPLRGVLVSLAGLIGITDDDGIAVFHVPKGNHTLRVERVIRFQGKVIVNSWKGSVNIEGEKTLTVMFKLFRILPASIDSSLNPFQTISHTSLTFNLPTTGKYYIGPTIITYYTPWGELRRTIGEPVEVTAKPEEMDEYVFQIDYSIDYEGVGSVSKVEKIPGNPSYIVPELTFLPVESVVVED